MFQGITTIDVMIFKIRPIESEIYVFIGSSSPKAEDIRQNEDNKCFKGTFLLRPLTEKG